MSTDTNAPLAEPAAGGSYLRDANGALVPVQQTQPAEPVLRPEAQPDGAAQPEA